MYSPTRFLPGLAIGFVLSTCVALAAAEADKALEESIRQLRMGTLVDRGRSRHRSASGTTAARVLVRGGAGQPACSAGSRYA